MFGRGSFVLFSYKQPVDGNNRYRFGVVRTLRDTSESPVRPSKYRQFDSKFRRTQMLMTVDTPRTVQQFYVERSNVVAVVPFVGYPLLWAKRLLRVK